MSSSLHRRCPDRAHTAGRAGPAVARVFAACLMVATLAPGAARADWLLAAPTPTAIAGQAVELIVLREPGDPELPEQLALHLHPAGHAVDLQAVSPEANGRRRYRGALPADLRGPVELGLPDGHRLQLTIVAPGASGEPGRGRPADGLLATPRLTGEAPALSGHEPMYFLIGRRHTTSARFQFSFKYRIFDTESAIVRWLPPLSGLHFAYSQTSLWDLTGESKPFRDNSYRPALLYHWQGGPAVGDHRAWRVEAGLEHESNGRDGERSRSINIAYLKPERRFALSPRRYLSVGAKLYHYLDREENADIVDTRGRADWLLRLGQEDGWQWSMTLRRGEAGVGSVQNEWSYPLRRPFFADTGGYVFIQHFNGFGETLLDYRTRNEGQVRFGFAIVR